MRVRSTAQFASSAMLFAVLVAWCAVPAAAEASVPHSAPTSAGKPGCAKGYSPTAFDVEPGEERFYANLLWCVGPADSYFINNTASVVSIENSPWEADHSTPAQTAFHADFAQPFPFMLPGEQLRAQRDVSDVLRPQLELSAAWAGYELASRKLRSLGYEIAAGALAPKASYQRAMLECGRTGFALASDVMEAESGKDTAQIMLDGLSTMQQGSTCASAFVAAEDAERALTGMPPRQPGWVATLETISLRSKPVSRMGNGLFRARNLWALFHAI